MHTACVYYKLSCEQMRFISAFHPDISSGADPGFWKGGSEHRDGSLKQGVWGCAPQKLYIGAPKSCPNARFKVAI